MNQELRSQSVESVVVSFDQENENQPLRFSKRRQKDLIREELQNDIEQWLAQGNRITEAPPALNCPNSRKVNVTDPSYFY